MIECRVPGDKSISHRSLLLAALATGESRIRGLLSSEDPRSTARVLRGLGAGVPDPPDDGREIRVEGRGIRGLREPDGPLDCGNSGTTARLLLGILAAHPFRAVVTGDASLRTRPMRRITGPLSRMGATFRDFDGPGVLPLEVSGGELETLEYASPVASAQVKSAILLAGLVGGVPVTVTEPVRSRDHTERLLSSLGVDVVEHPGEGGWRVGIPAPPAELPPLRIDVPGDFSSAAFVSAFALLTPDHPGLRVTEVGLNPTRTGLLPVLERMGARVEVEEGGTGRGGERMGTLFVRPSELDAVEVGRSEIPGMIDEVPVLAVLAARASGTTRITGAEELRVKESDRLAALAANLRAVGVEARELDDGLEIEGTDAPLRGRVDSHGDHRIAMAFGVLACLPGNRIEVEGAGAAGISFPGFRELLDRIAGAVTG